MRCRDATRSTHYVFHSSASDPVFYMPYSNMQRINMPEAHALSQLLSCAELGERA